MDFQGFLRVLEALASALNVVPFTLAVAGYILTSLGLYTMARNRGIAHSWLSWVPVANVWILGSLSDQYRYVARGQKKSRRWILISLKLVSGLIHTVALVLSVSGIAGAVVDFFQSASLPSGGDLAATALGMVLKGLGFTLVSLPVHIAFAVFYIMALYDVFLSCDPSNAVMYTVVGTLLGVTRPFFLFFNRNREDGMPPRKPQAPEFRPAAVSQVREEPRQEEAPREAAPEQGNAEEQNTSEEQ